VVQYCTCDPTNAAARREQLLDEKWFPATLVRPHTVFTFNLLDFFHQLQTQSKTNLYDFYNSIVRLLDSAGLSTEIVCVPHFISPLYSSDMFNQHRYNEISLVYRLWVHLRLLKCGGGGHDPGGIASLANGSMAVECPACPHPSRNLAVEKVNEV